MHLVLTGCVFSSLFILTKHLRKTRTSPAQTHYSEQKKKHQLGGLDSVNQVCVDMKAGGQEGWITGSRLACVKVSTWQAQAWFVSLLTPPSAVFISTLDREHSTSVQQLFYGFIHHFIGAPKAV